MLDKKFLSGECSYCVNIADMQDFLKECTEQAIYWRRGGIAESFDPFKFYEGDKIDYLKPIMTIEDRNYVYISCLNKRIDFTFELTWYTAPVLDYRPNHERGEIK